MAWTDEGLLSAAGVRVAFTERTGGVSQGAYASLDLATHVHDDHAAVERNRGLVLSALGAPGLPLVVPKQVHGDRVVEVPAADGPALEAARRKAQEGADALLCGAAGVACLLCYADCMPVVFVAPGGAFCVAHSGWRGTAAHIAATSLKALDRAAGCAPAECNAYIGPYIHAECFEVSEEVADRFAREFGEAAVPTRRHVDLGSCVRQDLVRQGVPAERVADVGQCTSCEVERFYSYRAEGGVCGRHGAVAFRL